MHLVKVGVYMGDHAQDVVTAVEVLPGETLHDAARRLLSNGDHWTGPDFSWRIEVQLVEPAPASDVTEVNAGMGDFDEPPAGTEAF